MENKKNAIKSLYIHFPFCRHLCNYCDFFKSIPKGEDDLTQFELQFKDSWDHHQNFLHDKDYQMDQLDTLYIGGGTPSLWGERGSLFLKNLFHNENLSLVSGGEFTLEVNPGSWRENDLKAWQSFGINRFSLGIQSLDQRFLKILDRVHNLQDVHDTLTFFSNNEFNFSVDLMMGLPFSEDYKRDIEKELEVILSYSPMHISLYILTIKDNYCHYDHMPAEEFVQEEYFKVVNLLKKRGFEHYEVSNFAKPGFESVHNLKYWNRNSVAALGPSATGFLKEDEIRYKWKPYRPDFDLENLTTREAELENLYLGLRLHSGVTIEELLEKVGSQEKLMAKIETWESSGLCTMTNGILKLTSAGFLIMDTILQDILKLTP